jgi:hypothetical protein
MNRRQGFFYFRLLLWVEEPEDLRRVFGQNRRFLLQVVNRFFPLVQTASLRERLKTFEQ